MEIDRKRRYCDIQYAEDFQGAWPDETRPSLQVCKQLQPDSSNEDLLTATSAYHYTFTREDSMSFREELPRGSITFQKVLEEIEEDMQKLKVTEAGPKPLVCQEKPRRKSLATPRYGTSAMLQRMRRQRHPASAMSTSYHRPRVNSDGIMFRRASNIQ